MKTHTSVILGALLLAPISALAADPPAFARAAPPALAPAAAASAASSAVRDRAALAKAAASMGYKPRRRDGQTVYCCRTTDIGSKFQSTTCITEPQLAAAVERSISNPDSVADMQKRSLLMRPAMEPSNSMLGMPGKQ